MASWAQVCFLFALIAIAFSQAEKPADDDLPDEQPPTDEEVSDAVLVLTKENFYQTINSTQFILVEFYAPWCGYCQQLEPEYKAAAKILESEESPIKMAKVDAAKETELAEQFGVSGFPTIKFFKDQIPMDYKGGRDAQGIVTWLKSKTGPPAKELATLDDAKSFIESNDVAVIGFFSDPKSAAAQVFLTLATSVDDQVFGITSDETTATEYKLKGDQVVVFNKNDDVYYYDKEMNLSELKNFVFSRSLPLVVEFNHQTAAKIFGGDIKSHILFFLSKKAGDYEKYIAGASNVAKDYRGEILFVSINADEEDHGRILEFFGMKKSEVPSMRGIRLEEDMSKYKPASADLSEETIKTFASDFAAGKLKKHLLAQDLPADWDAKEVKVLVAGNFKEIALNPDKDVLVEFYAPWCGHCKQLVPIYDELGEKFKDREDIVIAKLDATVNEIEDVKVTSFPTLTLYPKNNAKPIQYGGERTLAGLTKFIETGGEYGKGDAVEKEPEEEEEDDESKEDVPPVGRDEL